MRSITALLLLLPLLLQQVMENQPCLFVSISDQLLQI
jgi:hypothetical protein